MSNPPDFCDKCLKRGTTQRKIIKDLRTKLCNLMVEYHKLVITVKTAGILATDIDVNNYFKNEGMQKEFYEN